MQWPKKNSYKEFDNEKKFLRPAKFCSPPITFLMVGPLLLKTAVDEGHTHPLA